MPAQLVIRDGTPWWVSLDIWVVPGSDPDAGPGQPIAGQPNYVWARLRNEGDVLVEAVRLNYYWSNPATGVRRSNSTLIGTSFADVAAGELVEVLCLSEWRPIVVNDGHECLVVEAIHNADPLPLPLPDDFDPPAHHQIAQRNLTVIEASSASARFLLPIQLSAPLRRSKDSGLHVVRETDARVLKSLLAPYGLRATGDGSARLRLSLTNSCDAEGEEALERVHVPAGSSRSAFVSIDAVEGGADCEVFHVIESVEGKEVGGMTYVLVRRSEGAS